MSFGAEWSLGHFSEWTQLGACAYRFRVFWMSSRRLPGGDCTMDATQLTLQMGVNGNKFFFSFFPPCLSKRRMSAQYELMFITSDDKNNSITS